MTLTLEIAPEIEAALKSKARSRGVSLAAYVLDLARRDVAPDTNAPQRRASGFGKFAGIGPTVDEFHAAKQEEIEIEARRG